MKTFRLSRKVQIILATIFVIVAGVIIVGSVSNNEVFAASCPDCGKTYTKAKVVYIDSTNHGWYYYCTTCQREGSIYARYPHSPDADNCSYCGNFYDIGSGGGSSGHTCSNFTTHYEYAQKVPANDEVHERYFVCDTCGFSWYDCDLVHDGGNHYNGGECTLCGYQYERHSQSTQKTYNKTDSTHTLVYKCTYSGCNATYEGETEYHEGATHANGGKCTVCGYQYETHGKSTTVDYYNQTATTHTPVYYCTESGCSTTYTGTSENHKGATHANGGICTVCGTQYETHGQSSTIKEYQKTATGHTAVYSCTKSGCTSTYNGTEQAHTGGTHANDGICTVSGCGYKYQTHSQSSTIKEYKTTATGHTPVYKCTEASCTTTYDGTEEAHTGATHANGGKCTICGTQYETHGQSSTIKEYKKTATGHTPVYSCTQTGCTVTYEGTAEAHTGGTHENGGICTVCGKQYETHGPSSTPKDYKITETGHISIYACTQDGCTVTYEGTEEAHTGATHPDGKCTVCGTQYETHGPSSTPKDYKITETGHIPIYACTQDGCTVTYEGTEEAHNNETYVDNGDGTHSSTCTECGGVTTEDHNYENGECKDCKSKEPDINIETGEYEILEAYITQIQPKTTVSTFKNNIETNATEINIYNHNNELLKDTDIIGTGMKLELKKGIQIKKFTLIVRGDVDGDGTSGMVDMVLINKYRLHKINLEEAYLKAGDVTDDGKVDFFDIIKINKFRLKKIIRL